MTTLKDIYDIAYAMDFRMLEYNKEHLYDLRQDIKITIELPKIDFIALNEEIYGIKNHTMAGYEDCDKMELNVIGINFMIVKEKDSE